MTTNKDVVGPQEELSEAQLVERVRARLELASTQEALQELARRRSPLRLEVFRTVLEDPGQDSRTKRAAAVELGSERLPENQQLLLSHLDAVDAPLFAKVVQSLGQIGDEQALARLEQVAPPDSASAIKSLGFAKSLLAYRLHINRHLITPPPDAELMEVTEGIPFKAKAAEAEAVAEALQEAVRAVPGVVLTEEGALRLTCQSNELLVLFAEETRRPGAWELFQARNALPVVLMRKGLSLDRYFLEQYFFIHPAEGGGGMVVLGTRPTGELTFAGTIQPSAGGVRFTVRSVDTPLVAAIEAEGSYNTTRKSLKLTRAVTNTRMGTGKRKPGVPGRASLPVS